MTTILEGNPDQLESKANGYMSSAQAILEAAEELSSLVFDHRSAAVDEVSARTTKLAAGLKVAHSRYTGTASALKVYSVELRELQRRYRAAENEVGSLENVVGQADAAQERLKRTIRVYEQNGVADNVVTPFVDELRRWQQRDRNASELLSSARGASEQVEKDYEAAAKKAIAAIDTAIREGRDTLGDKFRKFVEDVYKTFVDIAKWVKSALEKVIKFLIDFVATIVTIILVALVIIGALVTLVAAVLALLVSPFLALGILLVGGYLVLKLVQGLILTRTLSDVLKPAPQLREHTPKYPDGDEPSSLEHVFDEQAKVDQEGGGADQAVVKIEKIVDAYGNVSWRVVLPSTQDWQALAPFMSEEQINFMKMLEDRGGTNDVDSNIALMYFPELRTQYERAVLDAMDRAGIKGGPNGDPVMLVGFSQGGIMAGHLAANRSDQYNFQAIVVCGAPIDHMDIPAKTTVISVQHNGDPVHTLDRAVNPLRSEPRNTDTWLSIVSDPPADATEVGDIHNANNYNRTLQENLDKVRAFDPSLENFFPGDSGETIRDSGGSEYYAWNE